MFSVNVTHLGGPPTFNVEVLHKNADDTAWGSAGTFDAIKTKDLTGLKEQLKFKYTFSAGSAGDFVHFIVPAPTWRPF